MLQNALQEHNTVYDDIKQYFGTGISHLGNSVYEVVLVSRLGKDTDPMGQYKLGDWFLELSVYKHFQRYFYPHIPMSQRAIIQFIVDRTFGWNKTSERIRKDHFYNGVLNVSDGCGLSRPTIDKVITEVVEAGFVKVLDGSFYALDLDCINEFLVSRGKGLMMRERKNKGFGERKPGKKTVKPLYNEDGENCKAPLHPYNKANDLNKSDKQDASRTTVSKGELLDRIKTNAGKKSDPAKEKIFAKARTLTDTSYYIQRSWEIKTASLYPDMIQIKWTDRTKAEIKRFLKSVSIPSGKTHADFFDFVAERWLAIKGQHFDYMNRRLAEQGKAPVDFPEFPSIQFVLGYKTMFLNAYQRELDDTLRTDQFDLRRLREAGYTDAEIDQVLSEKAKQENIDKHLENKLTKEMDEVRKEKQQLQAERQRVMQERERVGKQALEQKKNNVMPFRKPTLIDVPEQELSTPTKIEQPKNKYNLSDSDLQLAKEWHEQTKHWTTLEYVEATIASEGRDKAKSMLFD